MQKYVLEILRFYLQMHLVEVIQCMNIYGVQEKTKDITVNPTETSTYSVTVTEVFVNLSKKNLWLL